MNLLYFILVIFICYDSTCGLYEDQIGKFDWIQRYIGAVEHVAYDKSQVPSRKVIVSTKQNVVAALSLKNGEIVWRHVLEETDAGHVDFLTVRGTTVTVVTGNLVRSWDTITAALQDEVLLEYNNNHGTELLKKIVEENDNEMIIAELLTGSVEVTTYDMTNGAKLDHHTIPAPWLQQSSKCNSGGAMLVCVDPSVGLVFHVSLLESDKMFTSMPLSSIDIEEEQITSFSDDEVNLTTVPGSSEYLIVKVGKVKKLLHIHKSGIHLHQDISDIETLSVDQEVIYSLSQSNRQVKVISQHISTKENLAEQDMIVELPPHTGHVEKLAIYKFTRKDGGIAVRAFITCSDHSVHFLSNAGVLWSREEALSSVVVAESVDLPVAGAEINYQDQISLRSGLVGSLLHRVKTQWSQISNWFIALVKPKNDDDTTPLLLTRDQFNLHKLLIVITSSGKLFALDNWNGDIIWISFIPNLSTLSGGKFLLFTQRTVAHFPHEPQCTVIGRHKVTGEGMLYIFHPITGVGVGDNEGISLLGYKLALASLLHQSNEQFLKPLMLIDENMDVHVVPESGESVLLQNKDDIYVHLATPGTSNFQGFSMNKSTPGNLKLTLVWNLILGNGVITGVHSKLATEKVHSPGRVLADRSVLYKYVNPNLVVVTTISYDSINKDTLTLHLVDTVTGSVIESVVHKRVSLPIHVVHSENWVVYTCFNDKFRRFEVTTLEMFEGITQANATAFSSFGSSATPPLVERQAFIMPQGVQAVAHTTTEKSITTKYLLFGLKSGSVLQMSKWFLDPRRPITQGGPREEGLIPYMPELPIHPQEIITYNRTLPRISAIFTAPTGLESTCIVLVHGLDLFYTRVFPSKMYDMLKDDFDHYLISGALFIFVSAALITRKLAQRKALNQAWK